MSRCVMTDPKTMSGWRSVVVLWMCNTDHEKILGWLAQSMAGEDIGNLAAYNRLRPIQRAWVWEMRLRKHIALLEGAASLKDTKWEEEFEFPDFEDLVLLIGGKQIPLEFQDMGANSTFYFWSSTMRGILRYAKMVPLEQFKAKYTRSAAPAVKQEEGEPPVMWTEERAPPGARKGRPAPLVDPEIKQEEPW